MKAGDELLGAVFNRDHRYVIPIFQRPYVWDEEENWIPLWNDISKAAEDAEQQQVDGVDEAAREYFLGALVTQHRSPVPRRTGASTVIDGQQRMTTFQVFLAAARRVAVEFGAAHAADRLTVLVRNRVSADTEHPEDRFKISPLVHDRPAFEWAMREPGDDSRPVNPHHLLARAALWFEATLRDWVKEAAAPGHRLDLLHFAVENRIKVVSIFLDAKDDPQVIFEALNHRGVRLDAADLIKNLLFQTLNAQGEHHLEHELLTDHWSVLDSGHWREEVTTGRIKRVRVDTLLAYWLSAQRGEESSVEHLFEDFKGWMRATQATASKVIRDIHVYADTMDRLLKLPMSSAVAQVLDRLAATATTTPWPLLLFLHASSEIPDAQATNGTLAIDSFLMRRAICRMGTKDYNRLFGSVLGAIKDGDPAEAGDVLSALLAGQTAENRRWPDDSLFISALMNTNLYNDLVRARLRTLLVGLENHLLTATAKAEPTTPHRSAGAQFTIEHVLPVRWEENWALPGDATDEDRDRRQAYVHRLGNLTLVTRSLNSALSNAPWHAKRHTLQTHSLVRLTTGSILTFPGEGDSYTQDQWVSEWDEARIERRELALIDTALRAWPRPTLDTSTAGTATILAAVEVVDSQPLVSPLVSEGGAMSADRARARHEVSGDIQPLISAGLVAPGDRLVHRRARSGNTMTGTVTGSGCIETKAGTYKAPSTALGDLVGSSINGWAHWTHVPTDKTLGELRKQLSS